MKRTVKVYTILLVLFFLAWILVPTFNDTVQFYSEPSISKTENRVLARRPIVNLNLLDPYPRAYENFYNDHFLFRTYAVHARTYLNYYCFNRYPFPTQMDIGKKGWLFNGGDDKLIYQGKKSISMDSVRMIVRELHKRTLYLRRKGIRFYVAFAPMTQEIYPEFLPNNYFRGPVTQTDKIIAAIKRDTVIQFIDLKPELIAAKKFGRLYQKLDNHWNYIGGYYAYSAVIKRMKKDFPVLKPIPRSDVTFNVKMKNGGRMAAMMDFGDFMKETDYIPEISHAQAKPGEKAGYHPPDWFPYKDGYEVVEVIPDQKMPKLFVIRDSYFSIPMIYMQENFSKTTAIWDGWMYRANKALIQKEKPDIVLLFILEPLVANILGNPSE